MSSGGGDSSKQQAAVAEASGNEIRENLLFNGQGENSG